MDVSLTTSDLNNIDGDGEERALPVRGPSRKKLGSRAKSQFELLGEKNKRLIEWNTETLKTLLEAVINARGSSGATSLFLKNENKLDRKLRKGKMVFDEVAEIIKLPHYNQASVDRSKFPAKLSDDVVQEIRLFVSCIAKLYPDNPFHNFDHARYVRGPHHTDWIHVFSTTLVPNLQNC